MQGMLTRIGLVPVDAAAVLLATTLPLAFLVQLLWSEVALARRRIVLRGKLPVNPWLFFACKYLAIGAWLTVGAWSFGIGWRPFTGVRVPTAISWSLWIFGFGLMFFGRISLGTHFRLGLPNEATRFRRDGAFRFTRNPMYAGIDVTMIAAVLYTGNPVLPAVGAFVIAVQHRIILAEERWLRATFIDDYQHYQERVGRYVTLPLAVRSWVRALLTFLRMGDCAPTFMRSILGACCRPRTDWLVRLASSLPGGIGNTGSECGGITSPLMLLGLMYGLGNVENGLPLVFARSHNHIEAFRRHRCTVLCRQIRGTPNRVLPCVQAVVHTGRICADTLCGEARDVIPADARESYTRLYGAFSRCGFHCAQTVLRRLDGRIPSDARVLDTASAFLGGTAFAGMTCSALTAGAMALGLSIGEIEGSPLRVLRMAYFVLTGGPAFRDGVNKFNGAMNRGGELASWFSEQYGSTQCRAITKADFATRADVEAYLQGNGIGRCRRIAGSVAEQVRLMLERAPKGRSSGASHRGHHVQPAARSPLTARS